MVPSSNHKKLAVGLSKRRNFLYKIKQKAFSYEKVDSASELG